MEPVGRRGRAGPRHVGAALGRAAYQLPLCGQEPLPAWSQVRVSPAAVLVMMKFVLLFDLE
jgi:hypothetical protein